MVAEPVGQSFPNLQYYSKFLIFRHWRKLRLTESRRRYYDSRILLCSCCAGERGCSQREREDLDELERRVISYRINRSWALSSASCERAHHQQHLQTLMVQLFLSITRFLRVMFRISPQQFVLISVTYGKGIILCKEERRTQEEGQEERKWKKELCLLTGVESQATRSSLI